MTALFSILAFYFCVMWIINAKQNEDLKKEIEGIEILLRKYEQQIGKEIIEKILNEVKSEYNFNEEQV